MQNIQRPEFYGRLIFILAVILAMYFRFIGIISKFKQSLEVTLIVRHVFESLYYFDSIHLLPEVTKHDWKNKSVIFVLIFLLFLTSMVMDYSILQIFHMVFTRYLHLSYLIILKKCSNFMIFYSV